MSDDFDYARYDRIRPLRWTGQALEVLDQRKLPFVTEYLTCTTSDEVAAAIQPPLALHEIEKEHARELQQGKGTSIDGRGTVRHRAPKLLEGVPELAEEPRAEWLDGQQLREACGSFERRKL